MRVPTLLTHTLQSLRNLLTLPLILIQLMLHRIVPVGKIHNTDTAARIVQQHQHQPSLLSSDVSFENKTRPRPPPALPAIASAAARFLARVPCMLFMGISELAQRVRAMFSGSLPRVSRAAVAVLVLILCVVVGSLARSTDGRHHHGHHARLLMSEDEEADFAAEPEMADAMVMESDEPMRKSMPKMARRSVGAKPAMMMGKAQAYSAAGGGGINNLMMRDEAAEDGAQNDIVPDKRLIVKNGHLSIRAKNVSVARNAIVEELERLNGFVASENTHANPVFRPRPKMHIRRPPPDGYPPVDDEETKTPPPPPPQENVDLNLRIPAEHFESFVSFARRSASEVLSSSISGEDVTEQYVDAATRAKNLEAAHTRLLALMERANDVRSTLEVQRELTRVTGEMEAHKTRAMSLQKRATLSSLHVSISPPPPEQDPPPPRKPVPRLHRAFRMAVGVLVEAALRALDGAVYLVVLGVPTGVVVALVMCAMRSRSAGAPTTKS